MPKEKPIIFSTPLIPAIQNLKPGTWPPEPIDPSKPWKWKTRRVIKPQPFPVHPYHEGVNDIGYVVFDNGVSGEWRMSRYSLGDILWVRETFLINAPGGVSKYFYKAGAPEEVLGQVKAFGYRWRSPYHMPRAAARLFLEVTDVQVERLQDITEEDARAEGCGPRLNSKTSVSARQDFMHLWQQLNDKRGYAWISNPWVWVYSYMRLEGGGK